MRPDRSAHQSQVAPKELVARQLRHGHTSTFATVQNFAFKTPLSVHQHSEAASFDLDQPTKIFIRLPRWPGEATDTVPVVDLRAGRWTPSIPHASQTVFSPDLHNLIPAHTSLSFSPSSLSGRYRYSSFNTLPTVGDELPLRSINALCMSLRTRLTAESALSFFPCDPTPSLSFLHHPASPALPRRASGLDNYH